MNVTESTNGALCEADDCQRIGMMFIPHSDALVCDKHFEEWESSVIDMLEYRLEEWR